MRVVMACASEKHDYLQGEKSFCFEREGCSGYMITEAPLISQCPEDLNDIYLQYSG